MPRQSDAPHPLKQLDSFGAVVWGDRAYSPSPFSLRYGLAFGVQSRLAHTYHLGSILPWAQVQVSNRADRSTLGFLQQIYSTAAMRGIDYRERDCFTLMRQANSWLLRLHSDCRTEIVDFDLMAVFIMQEMGDELHIKNLVNMVIGCFSPPNPPQTTRQNQLLHAALLVRDTIQGYERRAETSQAKPHPPVCLRYPTLVHVRERARGLEQRCRLLDPKRMVILLDENGVCVGIGLPPYPAPSEGSVHIRHDVSWVFHAVAYSVV
jgi:hypothetical protein